jgi:hypothetical protein
MQFGRKPMTNIFTGRGASTIGFKDTVLTPESLGINRLREKSFFPPLDDTFLVPIPSDFTWTYA